MKDILEFINIKVQKKVLNHAILWDTQISLQLNEISTYAREDLSVALFLEGEKIAEAKPDNYGYIYIELINQKLPQKRDNLILTARVSNSNIEALSQPFSLEFIHSNIKAKTKSILWDILDWIDHKIIQHKKRNITIGVLTFGVWFVMLFWIFIFTKVSKIILKIFNK